MRGVRAAIISPAPRVDTIPACTRKPIRAFAWDSHWVLQHRYSQHTCGRCNHHRMAYGLMAGRGATAPHRSVPGRSSRYRAKLACRYRILPRGRSCRWWSFGSRLKYCHPDPRSSLAALALEEADVVLAKSQGPHVQLLILRQLRSHSTMLVLLFADVNTQTELFLFCLDVYKYYTVAGNT